MNVATLREMLAGEMWIEMWESRIDIYAMVRRGECSWLYINEHMPKVIRARWNDAELLYQGVEAVIHPTVPSDREAGTVTWVLSHRRISSCMVPILSRMSAYTKRLARIACVRYVLKNCQRLYQLPHSYQGMKSDLYNLLHLAENHARTGLKDESVRSLREKVQTYMVNQGGGQDLPQFMLLAGTTVEYIFPEGMGFVNRFIRSRVWRQSIDSPTISAEALRVCADKYLGIYVQHADLDFPWRSAPQVK